MKRKIFLKGRLYSEKIKLCTFGLICGIINGLLGAGGGLVTVFTLIKSGVKTKKAHATSVCIIFPICVLSSVIYISKGKVNFSDSLPYLPFGIIGSILGGTLLQKLKTNVVKKIFGVIMLWAAIKMLF